MEFCWFLRSVKFVVRSLGRFLGRGVCLWLQWSQGTVEPRLSGPRLSGLFDYPDFFSGPVFFMNINKL